MRTDRETATAPTPEWEELANRVQRGEEAAIQELYDVFSKGIRFMLLRQLGPHDLDDKVHDLFITITESIRAGELRDPTRLIGYIHAIVKRQIAGYIDRTVTLRKQVELNVDEAIYDARLDPEAEAMEHELRERLRLAIAELPAREAEVFCLRYFEELSYDKIAETLGIRRGAVAAALHKARSKLEACLLEAVKGE